MDQVRKSIQTVRSTISLRPVNEVIQIIQERINILETKEELSPIEKYAAAVGRKALHDIQNVETEEDGIRVITIWTRMSLTENVDEKRLIVAQVGSVLLATDFKR